MQILSADRTQRRQPLLLTVGWIASSLLLWNQAAIHAQPPFPGLFQESVSIPVDNDAAKTLLTISDRWDLGRWEDALDDLIELCETRGDAIVQIDRGTDLGVTRYVRVAAACEKWLADLPPEGLQRYRQRVDPATELLWKDWETSGDEAVLLQIVQRAFYSSRGDDALWHLGQVAWTRGDLAAARHWWMQLLPSADRWKTEASRQVPETRFAAADVAARLVLCEILLDPAAGATALQHFAGRYPDSRGRLGSESGTWVELLTAFQKRATTTPSMPSVDVSTFAGNAARNGTAPHAVDLGAELWSLPLTSVAIPRVPQSTLFAPARPLASYPAVVDDVVYINDGSSILAVSLYSGNPVWNPLDSTAATIYPQFPAGEILPPRRPVQGAPLWTVTIGAGRLYANVGSAITTSSPLENREHSTDLVCLDLQRDEGKLLWKLSSTELSQRISTDDPDAPFWMWEGTPLLKGTRLYAALSRRRPQVEWSIVCLDAESGQLLWHRPAGISRPTPPEGENLASHLLLTADAQRLYLATHWGALIALDGRTGTLDWAVTYRSESRTEGQFRRDELWAAAPCVVAGDQIVLAAADSSSVMSFRSQTGELVWRTPCGEVTSLLYRAPDRIVASGTSAYGLEAATGALVWSLEPDEPEDRGYGRGWICGDQLLWPSREALLLIDPLTGGVLREQPLLTPDQRREGGHVVVAGPVTLVASSDQLTAYGQSSGIRQSRADLLSQAPGRAARWQWQLGELSAARDDFAQARDHWTAAVQQPATSIPVDETWSTRAERRLVECRMVSADGNSASIEERLAQGRQFAKSAPVRRELARLALTWSKVPHSQVRAWSDWLDLARGTEGSLQPDRPTPWEAAQRLLGLRRTFGDGAFVRYDDRAEARWRALQSLESETALRLARLEFPAAKWSQITLGRSLEFDVSNQKNSSSTAPISASIFREISSDFWERRWMRALPPGARLLSVESAEADNWEFVLLAGKTLEAWNRQTGERAWQVDLLAAPQWAGLSNGCLYCGTADEIVCVDAKTGDIDWRRPREEAELSRSRGDFPTATLWRAHPQGLICSEDRNGVRFLDGQTGEMRWRSMSQAALPQFSAVTENWLLTAPFGPTGPMLTSIATGRASPVRWPAMRDWLRAPVVSPSGNEFVTVDDQRTISAWTTSGLQLWTYSGATPFAHRDPLPIFSRDRWVVLLDGMRLAAIGEQGRPTSQVSIAALPLPEVSGSYLIVGDVLVAGHAGQCVAVRLSRLGILWRRNLPAMQSVEWFPLTGRTDSVGVVQKSSAGVSLEIWDVGQGSPIQTLWSSPRVDQSVEMETRAGQILMAEGTHLTAWSRIVPR